MDATESAAPSRPAAESYRCRLCRATHALRLCPTFVAMDASHRMLVARAHDYCTNCLAVTHSSSECTSKNRCRVCKKEHHSLLHNSNKTGKRGKKSAPKGTTRNQALTSKSTTLSQASQPERATRSHAPPHLTIRDSITGLQTAAFRSKEAFRLIGEALWALCRQ